MAKGLVFGGLNKSQSNIKSIQTFEVSVLSAEGTKNVSIASVDISKSIILIHGSDGTAGYTPDHMLFVGSLYLIHKLYYAEVSLRV